MRPVPISPKLLFKQKVASGTGDYLVRRKIPSEDSFVFLCLSSTSDEKMNENAYKTILGN